MTLEEFPKTNNTSEVPKQLDLKTRVFRDIRDIFRHFPDKAEKLDRFKERIGRLLNPEIIPEDVMSLPEIEEALKRLEAIAELNKEQEFIIQTYDLIRPIINLAESDPIKFESLRRKIFMSNEQFIPLNSLLSYGKGWDSTHIHLAPAKNIKSSEIWKNIQGGLEELALIVRDDKSIRKIVATSPLIGVKSGRDSIVNRYHFNYLGKLSDEDKAKYFSNEARPVGKAYISRENFLEHYLKSNG